MKILQRSWQDEESIKVDNKNQTIKNTTVKNNHYFRYIEFHTSNENEFIDGMDLVNKNLSMLILTIMNKAS